MEFLNPKNLNLEWTKFIRYGVIFSLALTILGLVGMLTPGLNYGIDFRGGVSAHLSFKDGSINEKDLRAVLEGSLKNLQVVKYSSQNGSSEFEVSAQGDDQNKIMPMITGAIETKFGVKDQAWSVQKVDMIGPKVSANLRKSALLSLFYTCILVTLYMYWRFDMRYSPGALAGIFHDLIATVAFLVITQTEFTTTVVAALLTLAGYSINDTVVIFDRIREIEGKSPHKSAKSIVNEALNSTFPRTVITSLTTIFACIILIIFGNEELKGFASTLIVGILIGTYSSAFVASPLYLWADKKFGRAKLETQTA